MIGARAGSFCDEWFGDDPAVLEKILVRVMKLSPSSESALQRLSVIYTVGERWNDALSLYDSAVGATKDKPSRVKLLREAAQLAKDVANQPDKAIRTTRRAAAHARRRAGSQSLEVCSSATSAGRI